MNPAVNHPIRLAVIGDYDPAFPPHPATDAAIAHAAAALELAVEATWLPTAELAAAPEAALRAFDAFWGAPGSPYRSMEGALRAIRFAREAGRPFLGTCGGFQHAVLEFARSVLGFADAQHAEYDPYASNLFIAALPCSLVGKTMRVTLRPGSRARDLYAAEAVEETYYCNFGLDRRHAALLEAGGFRTTGVDQDGEPRLLELAGHPFFVATLFVPQLRSTPAAPHPLVRGLLHAAGQSPIDP